MSQAIKNLLRKSSINLIQRCTLMTSSVRFCNNTVAPTNFQKKVLVWTKFYSSVDQVPKEISVVQMKKAHDLFRVKANIIMVITAFLALGISMASGAYLRRSGDSVGQRGLNQIEEWKKK